MFVLRQLNNKINTMVASMSVICLMLFMTISILSSSLALRNSMQQDLIEMTPVDLNLTKTANLPEKYVKYGREIETTEKQREDSKISIKETLINNGFDMKLLKDVVEVPIYASNNFTWGDFCGDKLEKLKLKYPMLQYGTAEQIVKVSDYNKIARLYKTEEYSIDDDEFIMLCNFDSMKQVRDMVLANGNKKIEIAGKQYKSKYNECKNGYIEMTGSHTNTGIILVPDNCLLSENDKEIFILASNYNANSDEEREEIDNLFKSDDSILIKNLDSNGLELDGQTKITVIQSSVGLATIITFIAIYLGIIFLIASSAILALKQLTESSDNKERYIVLRKIGCDEKMINRALFRQIGIFFMAPLTLGIIHSIFGIQFALEVMAGLASKNELLPSAIATVVIIGLIYGAYFLATYLGSKNIIKEE